MKVRYNDDMQHFWFDVEFESIMDQDSGHDPQMGGMR